MAIKKETRILKTNTFEGWRQKDNQISLHLGDVSELDTLINDKEYSTTASAGDTVFAATRFEFLNEETLDSINDYIILKNNPSVPSSYVTNATVSQTGGFTATIVSVIGTTKIYIKNSSGTFNASQKITVGSDDIVAANVSRTVSEAYPKGSIRVYKNGTEQLQTLGEPQGFHVVNYQYDITLTGSPTLPATFTEGATIFQGSNDVVGSATWSGVIYDITATKIRLKSASGTFSVSTLLRVDGNTGASNQIAAAKISDSAVVDYSYGRLIELHTGVSANDVIKIDANNVVEAINELQDDIGDVTIINDATGYSATQVATGITEIQGDIGDITGLGTTTQSNLVSSINEIETAVRGSAGNYTLGTAATDLVAAVNEIEAVFDASTYEISAGSNAFTVTSGEFTLDSSGDIVLDADGGDIKLKDGGTQYANLAWGSGNNLVIQSGTTTMLTGSGANATFAGNLEVDGTGGFDGNFRVGGSEYNNATFTVQETTGNTVVDGTFHADGNATVGGTLSVDGSFAVGSDKFNVTASSGNTQVDGTFNVDGATTLNGTAIDGNLDLNGSADVSASIVIHGNIDVDGTSNFDVVDIDGAVDMATTLGVTGNTTIGGILDVGQLNTKFTNRNNVKLALNELHDEVGVGGNAFSALTNHSTSGQTNITSAVVAINADIGDVSSSNTILDNSGNHAHKSATVSGVLDNLSAAIVSNDTDIAGNDTDISTINTKLGTISAAGMGTSASTVSTAIAELHGEINGNDTDITALQGNGSSTGRLRLDNTGTQTTAGNITFGGSKTIKIHSDATLNVEGTLLVGGAGGGSLTYATAFITIAGEANVEGLKIDRSEITGGNYLNTNDATLKWRDTKVASGANNKSHRAWQFDGFTNASTPVANTTDVVTFYNAKDLLKNQTAASGSSEVYGAWTATTDSEGFNLHLNNSGVTAATYGSTTAIPEIVIDAKGRITSATNRNIATALTISSDGSGDNAVDLLTEVLEISGGTNITTTTQTNGITVNLNSSVTHSGTLDVTGAVNFNSTTDATSATAGGSLTVDGGAAIAKKLWVGTDLDVTGNAVIDGNLTVSGTLVSVNATDLEITDKNILLGKGSTTSATNAGTGITFGEYGAAATFNYSHSGTKLVANKSIQATSFIGNADSADVLSTGATVGMTGDVTWTSNTNFTGAAAVTGTSSIGAEKVKEPHLNISNAGSGGDVLSKAASGDGFTWTTIGAGTTVGKHGATQRSGSIWLKPGTNVTINESPNGTFEFVSSYVNTTYTAGTDLTLSGTTFNHDDSGVASVSGYPTFGETGTEDGSYIKSITVNSRGHVTAVSADDFDDRYILSSDSLFVVEDGDGNEVTILQDKEWKFVEGASSGGSNYININWSDTSTGSDADPYDLTFNHNNTTKTTTTTTAAPGYGATFTAIGGITTNVEGHVTNVETKTITIPASDNTNTQNTYAISCVDGDTVATEKIRLTGAGEDGATTDDVVIAAGTGLTIARSGDTITLTNSAPDVNHNSDTIDMGDGFKVANSSGTDQFTVTENEKIRFAGSGATAVAFDDTTQKVTVSSTNTEYTTATSSTLGLVKIGYTESTSLKQYPVELTAGQMFVHVPWVDTTTNTQNEYTITVPGGTTTLRLQGQGHDGETTADINVTGSGATTVTRSASQVLDISSTDHTYTAGTNMTLSGTQFNCDADVNQNAFSNIQSMNGSVNGTLHAADSTTDTFTLCGANGLDVTDATDKMTLAVSSSQKGVIFSWGASGTAYHSMNSNQSSIYFSSAEEFRFTSGGDLHADGDITAFSGTISSDRKLKENIKVVDGALAKVCELEGVTFDWKKDGKASAGVIAQNVEKIMPSAVKEVESLGDKDDTHKVVDYNQLSALFIEAIKELKEENNYLRSMVEELKDINS